MQIQYDPAEVVTDVRFRSSILLRVKKITEYLVKELIFSHTTTPGARKKNRALHNVIILRRRRGKHVKAIYKKRN